MDPQHQIHQRRIHNRFLSWYPSAVIGIWLIIVSVNTAGARPNAPPATGSVKVECKEDSVDVGHPGFERFAPSSKYVLIPTSPKDASFIAGKSLCDENGLDLGIIKSLSDYKTVVEFLKKKDPKCEKPSHLYLIGSTRQERSSIWSNADGSLMSFQAFGVMEPLHGNLTQTKYHKDYAVLICDKKKDGIAGPDVSYVYRDIPDPTPNPVSVICQFEPDTACFNASEETKLNDAIVDEVTVLGKIQNKEYYAGSVQKNWSSAYSSCFKEGMQLLDLELSDESEAVELKQLLQKFISEKADPVPPQSVGFFTSGRFTKLFKGDDAVQFKIKWADGYRIPAPTNPIFKIGPNVHHQPGKCLVVGAFTENADSELVISQGQCDVVHFYICQKDLGKPAGADLGRGMYRRRHHKVYDSDEEYEGWRRESNELDSSEEGTTERAWDLSELAAAVKPIRPLTPISLGRAIIHNVAKPKVNENTGITLEDEDATTTEKPDDVPKHPYSFGRAIIHAVAKVKDNDNHGLTLEDAGDGESTTEKPAPRKAISLGRAIIHRTVEEEVTTTEIPLPSPLGQFIKPIAPKGRGMVRRVGDVTTEKPDDEDTPPPPLPTGGFIKPILRGRGIIHGVAKIAKKDDAGLILEDDDASTTEKPIVRPAISLGRAIIHSVAKAKAKDNSGLTLEDDDGSTTEKPVVRPSISLGRAIVHSVAKPKAKEANGITLEDDDATTTEAPSDVPKHPYSFGRAIIHAVAKVKDNDNHGLTLEDDGESTTEKPAPRKSISLGRAIVHRKIEEEVTTEKPEEAIPPPTLGLFIKPVAKGRGMHRRVQSDDDETTTTEQPEVDTLPPTPLGTFLKPVLKGRGMVRKKVDQDEDEVSTTEKPEDSAPPAPATGAFIKPISPKGRGIVRKKQDDSDETSEASKDSPSGRGMHSRKKSSEEESSSDEEEGWKLYGDDGRPSKKKSKSSKKKSSHADEDPVDLSSLLSKKKGSSSSASSAGDSSSDSDLSSLIPQKKGASSSSSSSSSSGGDVSSDSDLSSLIQSKTKASPLGAKEDSTNLSDIIPNKKSSVPGGEQEVTTAPPQPQVQSNLYSDYPDYDQPSIGPASDPISGPVSQQAQVASDYQDYDYDMNQDSPNPHPVIKPHGEAGYISDPQAPVPEDDEDDDDYDEEDDDGEEDDEDDYDGYDIDDDEDSSSSEESSSGSGSESDESSSGSLESDEISSESSESDESSSGSSESDESSSGSSESDENSSESLESDESSESSEEPSSSSSSESQEDSDSDSDSGSDENSDDDDYDY